MNIGGNKYGQFKQIIHIIILLRNKRVTVRFSDALSLRISGMNLGIYHVWRRPALLCNLMDFREYWKE